MDAEELEVLQQTVRDADQGDFAGARATLYPLVEGLTLKHPCRKPLKPSHAGRLTNLILLDLAGPDSLTEPSLAQAQADLKVATEQAKSWKATDPKNRWHVAWIILNLHKRRVLDNANRVARRQVAGAKKKADEAEKKADAAEKKADAAEKEAAEAKTEAAEAKSEAAEAKTIANKALEAVKRKSSGVSSPTAASPTKRRASFASRDIATSIDTDPSIGAERRIGVDGKAYSFLAFTEFYNGDVRTAEKWWKLCTVDRSSIPTVDRSSSDSESDADDSGASDSSVRQAMYASMSPSREMPDEYQ